MVGKIAGQQGTLRLREVDLRGEPLLKRKRLLEKLVSGNPRILYVDHMEREGLATGNKPRLLP